MRVPSLLAALVAISVASFALAQTPSTPAQTAPAAAPAPTAPAAPPAPAAAVASTTAPTYPAPACTAPEYPGKSGSNAQIQAFNRDFKTYADCMRKYVDDAKAASSVAIEAGNKAVGDYNKYTEAVKKQIEADKQ